MKKGIVKIAAAALALSMLAMPVTAINAHAETATYMINISNYGDGVTPDKLEFRINENAKPDEIEAEKDRIRTEYDRQIGLMKDYYNDQKKTEGAKLDDAKAKKDSDLADNKEQAADLKKKLNTAKDTRNEALRQAKIKRSNAYDTAKSAYNDAKDTAKNARDKAKDAYSDAKGVYKDSLSKAKDVYNDTKKGNSSAAKSKYKSAQNAAKSALNTAKKAYDKANKDYKAALNKAKTAYNNAKKKAKDTYNAEKKTADDAYKKEKAGYDEAQEELKKKRTEINKKYAQDRADIKESFTKVADMISKDMDTAKSVSKQESAKASRYKKEVEDKIKTETAQKDATDKISAAVSDAKDKMTKQKDSIIAKYKDSKFSYKDKSKVDDIINDSLLPIREDALSVIKDNARETGLADNDISSMYTEQVEDTYSDCCDAIYDAVIKDKNTYVSEITNKSGSYERKMTSEADKILKKYKKNKFKTWKDAEKKAVPSLKSIYDNAVKDINSRCKKAGISSKKYTDGLKNTYNSCISELKRSIVKK